MRLSFDDWDVEMKERAAFGDELHGITVGPVGRRGMLPEWLQLAKATGIPRSDHS